VDSRVPPMAGLSPPPSPPANILPNNTKRSQVESSLKPSSCALVSQSEAALSNAAFQMRMQPNPKMLPQKDIQEVDAAWETWDDRTVREIIWGIAREHTAIGFVSSFLFGAGPKLPTVAQAAQLFWFAIVWLLFMACAQLRYAWFGARWESVLPTDFEYVDADLISRMPIISAVSTAAAIVCCPVVLFARWLFLVANNTQSGPPHVHAVVQGSSWSIVFLVQLAVSVGAVNMASNMDTRAVKEDVMLAWGLSAAVLWLLVEPGILALYGTCTLLLKWCTTFEDLPEFHAEEESKKG